MTEEKRLKQKTGKEERTWACELCNHGKLLTKNGYNRHKRSVHGIFKGRWEKSSIETKKANSRKRSTRYRQKKREKMKGKTSLTLLSCLNFLLSTSLSFYFSCPVSSPPLLLLHTTAVLTIAKKMKEYQVRYGIPGEADQLSPASCLQAEKSYWESCQPSTIPEAPAAVYRPPQLILPIHGRSWRDEHIRIPTKAIKRIKAHVGKSKERVTHVKRSAIKGHGLFASKCFNRYVALHAYIASCRLLMY